MKCLYITPVMWVMRGYEDATLLEIRGWYTCESAYRGYTLSGWGDVISLCTE